MNTLSRGENSRGLDEQRKTSMRSMRYIVALHDSSIVSCIQSPMQTRGILSSCPPHLVWPLMTMKRSLGMAMQMRTIKWSRVGVIQRLGDKRAMTKLRLLSIRLSPVRPRPYVWQNTYPYRQCAAETSIHTVLSVAIVL